ncbi:MAG: hypothetical protein IPG91_05030 [Ideonella sp.]|nr:hypothetical protein [Ideonella sp.]
MNGLASTANDTTATFGNQALHALKFAQLVLACAMKLGSDWARRALRGAWARASVSKRP